MATAEEALEKMREICLSLPDTREGDHFGETAFYAGEAPRPVKRREAPSVL